MKAHQLRQSSGYDLARNRLLTMSETELSELTPERLIASYGLRFDEAERIIKGFRRH